MSGDAYDPAVESYVASAPPEIEPILRDLLDLVRETLPDADETIKWGRPVFTGGADVCYLAKARGHATLGFYRGVELADPEGLLEGAGKRLRHVKIPPGSQIPRPVLQGFLRSAWKLSPT